VLGRWLIAVPTAYLLGVVFKMGPAGVWWGLVTGTVVAGFYVLVRWLNGRWVGVALRKTDLYRRHLVGLPEEVRGRYLREVRTPTMARPGTTEHVEETEVFYKLDSSVVRIHFTQGDYELTKEGQSSNPIGEIGN
jgi:hypothetical protein